MITRAVAAALVAAVLPAVWTSPASADDSSQLRTALGASAAVTGAALEGPTGSAAIISNRFDGFPRQSPAGTPAADQHGADGQYVVLSTGRASDLFDRNLGASAQPSTDLPGKDVSTLRLDVAAAPTTRCLSVDVAMGTEERVHTYSAGTPSDAITITRGSDPTDYARHAGNQLFDQPGALAKTVALAVNDVNYWHAVGDVDDRETGSSSMPWAPRTATPFDHFTLPDSYTVPLPAGAAQTVRVSVADAGNELLDSVALVDRVRVLETCPGDAAASTGIFAAAATIRGDRGVGNTLTLDPDASTTKVEQLEDVDNGWYAGSGRGVDLRVRWYQYYRPIGGQYCESTSIKEWIPIPDADRQSYVPTVKQRYYCIIALVTGAKDGWRTETFPSPEKSWGPTQQIGNGQFVDTYQPAILDTATNGVPTRVENGQKLTAEPRDFAPLQERFTYQWQADGIAILGATAKDFVVTEAQAGKALTVKVTAERLFFDDRSVTSAATPTVEPASMVATPAPRIVGDPVVDGQLSWEADPWTPKGATFSQVWYVDGQRQPLTNRTLTVKSSWAGKQLTVAITGSKAGYAPVTQTSDPVTIGAAAMEPGDPVVTGDATVGSRLTANVSSWRPIGSEFTYTWKAGGSVLQTVAGPTGRSLTIPGKAAGKPITVSVEGRREGYVPTTRTSAPTGLVARASMTPGTPRVSGSLKVGKVLTVSPGVWRPIGITYRYRWSLNGRPVSGATRSTYRLPRSAKGKRVSVRVTGVLTGYVSTARGVRVPGKVR